jgi:hypothetical protein
MASMLAQPTRLYTMFIGIALVLQGSVTLLARLYPPFDRAFPFVLEMTKLIPSHSLLHIATAIVAFGLNYWGGPRGPFRFALGFGLFYLALAIVGMISGHPLGLGLHAFDHPFHLFIGVLGLLAVAVEVVRARAASS